MAGISRLKAGSSAEEVEYLDELITNIISRVSTRDVVKMSSVRKKWRTLIFDPGFAYTHYKNCPKESIFCLTDITERQMPKQYQFHCYNYRTGNLSFVPLSSEGLDSSFRNGRFRIVTVSNGLMCLYADDRMLWMYNPVTRFLKKLPVPVEVNMEAVYFAEICCTQNTIKFVMAGLSLGKEQPYTLRFDSHLNSWYSVQPLPLLRVINEYQYSPYRSLETQVFFNGVIYFVVRVDSRDAHELEGFSNLEGLYKDGDNYLHMIIGYDVIQDQWGFTLFVPASVGFVYHLIEWEGNLLVCGSEECLGHFVFWILDTENKLWIQEREIDLSHGLHTSWEVSASGGLIWFTCGYNCVIVYDMKDRYWSRYGADDAFGLQQPRVIPSVTFEPTLLSF